MGGNGLLGVDTHRHLLYVHHYLNNPTGNDISGRLRIVALTAAMWVVYRLAPCRALVSYVLAYS